MKFFVVLALAVAIVYNVQARFLPELVFFSWNLKINISTGKLIGFFV